MTVIRNDWHVNSLTELESFAIDEKQKQKKYYKIENTLGNKGYS